MMTKSLPAKACSALRVAWNRARFTFHSRALALNRASMALARPRCVSSSRKSTGTSARPGLNRMSRMMVGVQFWLPPPTRVTVSRFRLSAMVGPPACRHQCSATQDNRL